MSRKNRFIEEFRYWVYGEFLPIKDKPKLTRSFLKKKPISSVFHNFGPVKNKEESQPALEEKFEKKIVGVFDLRNKAQSALDQAIAQEKERIEIEMEQEERRLLTLYPHKELYPNLIEVLKCKIKEREIYLSTFPRDYPSLISLHQYKKELKYLEENQIQKNNYISPEFKERFTDACEKAARNREILAHSIEKAKQDPLVRSYKRFFSTMEAMIHAIRDYESILHKNPNDSSAIANYKKLKKELELNYNISPEFIRYGTPDDIKKVTSNSHYVYKTEKLGCVFTVPTVIEAKPYNTMPLDEEF